MVIPSDLSFWIAVLALVMGILVLIFPRFSTYLIAVYLIAAGLLGILNHLVA